MQGTRRNATNSSSEAWGDLFQTEVREVRVSELRPHPQNSYSMDPDELASLMSNIEEVGLIEWPLVREVDDGGLQILSGHRRVKALQKLAKKDPAWETAAVRVVRGISDEDALLILHSGNIYREITREERVEQYERLGAEIAELRESHPEWKGVRTDQIMSEILGFSSLKTFQRRKKIEMDLVDELYAYYEQGLIGEVRSVELAGKSPEYQREVAAFLDSRRPETQHEANVLLEAYDKGVGQYLIEANKHLVKADAALFRARELLLKDNRVSVAEYERMWSMKNLLEKMIKESRKG